MTTTNSILKDIEKSFEKVYKHFKSLAPYNTNYMGLYDFKPSNFIFVNNKRVYGNTNQLYNSVRNVKSGNEKGLLVHEIVVSSKDVPYYEKAVFSKTLTRAFHYGRIEYGDVRYVGNETWKTSRVEEVENRNYMYYMEGSTFMKSEFSRFNGKTYHVSDDIRRYKNGL